MPDAGGVSHIVLTVHGIRTFGDWADRLARILRESDPDTVTLKHGYGWVSMPAFLIPPFGWYEVRLFRKELKTLARRHPNRKSTRLNSSHLGISYAVFCLKKKGA